VAKLPMCGVVECGALLQACLSVRFSLTFLWFFGGMSPRCVHARKERNMLEQYVPIGIMMIVAIGFGIVLANINKWIGPRKPNDEKLSTYESGMEPVKSARERFSIKFYLVAMLFIVFDIEIVFMYPWAVKFKELGIFGFVEMFVFIAILLVGFVYVWRKGALRWD
jgi:NADH-quinone oxidoreductase subunit A